MDEVCWLISISTSVSLDNTHKTFPVPCTMIIKQTDISLEFVTVLYDNFHMNFDMASTS